MWGGWQGSAVQAQYLVPNWSFEEYSNCPEEANQLNGNVTGWSTSAPSPDYFNECGTSADYGIPSNRLGFQWAAEGSGYAGVVTYVQNVAHAREIIYAQLLMPLTIGVPAYLSMKIALGGFSN